MEGVVFPFSDILVECVNTKHNFKKNYRHGVKFYFQKKLLNQKSTLQTGFFTSLNFL